MIKNIVFDMGKVLVDYDPMKVCNVFVEKEEDKLRIIDALFHSPEWIELDRGALTELEAMEIIKSRLPEAHLKEQAQKCMDHWDEYNMTPKEGMKAIVEMVKEQGYGIYLLSNASLRLRSFQKIIPGIELFDGIIVSAEELCIKPDPHIYEILFERYHLKSEECFFIDDLQENIEGAQRLGMKGYCFADGNVERLKQRFTCLDDTAE